MFEKVSFFNRLLRQFGPFFDVCATTFSNMYLKGPWRATALTQSRSRSPTALLMEDAVMED